jgi:hypothetical protein
MSIDLSEIERDHISFQICKQEYESSELNSVLAWLKDHGWTMQNSDWGVVGSQEITVNEITKGGYTAYLVFETYQGVTLYTKPENKTLFSEIKIYT